jgi:hypothetical protein
MRAMTRFCFCAAIEYPSVAPTDHPILPYCCAAIRLGRRVGEEEREGEERGEGEERMGEERMGEGRMGEERMGEERMGEERMGEERMGEERMGEERMGEERMGENTQPFALRGRGQLGVGASEPKTMHLRFRQ